MQFTSETPTDLTSAAHYAMEQLQHNPIMVFHGEMGAGKTTFIKALCQQMGITEEVSSPTFSLVNEYRLPDGKPVFHFDFYRIQDESEALDMGIYEYFDSGICLIEWGEKIEGILAKEKHTSVRICEENGKRILTFGN